VAREPEKPQILKWLLRQDLIGVRSCSSLLTEGAAACLGKDIASASAYTEANTKSFWNYVLLQHTEQLARGLSPSFSIHSDTSKSWNCYPVSASLTGAARRRATRVRTRPSFLRMIDTLSDREYEALACILLEVLGCTHVTLTRRGNEGGIDAFGLLVNASSSHLLGSTSQPVRLVIQAKKYSRPMAADTMKEFIQTLSEVRHGGQRTTESVVPAWFRAARGAIVGLTLSHSGYQSGAESRGRSHGILMADSIDVAEILAAKNAIYGKRDVARLGACESRIKILLADSEPNDQTPRSTAGPAECS